MEKPTFIDLFCGCGGFSLGMQRSGFQLLAAADFNPEAITVFKKNFPQVSDVLLKDLTRYSPAELSETIGRKTVDVIVGGPPCQGFSTARQVDGSNSGDRLKHDPRRLLYREYLRFVEFFQPKIFVIENVLGIRSAEGGKYFTAVQKEARQLGRRDGKPGYRVHSQIEDAYELGVPQKRRRQLIIGVRADLPGFFPPNLYPAPRAVSEIKLGPVLGDLPTLRAGGGEEERDYDFEKRARHLQDYQLSGQKYLFQVLEVKLAKKLTAHTARPHSERDLRDFKLLKEGESSAVALRRGVEFEFPYSREKFKDRYTRQGRWLPCSTITAHLSKDGLMFIHPTQNRSLTPREAARIQSFPDWFEFPVARTHQFRVIGNAVPPLVAEAVGLALGTFLKSLPSNFHSTAFPISTLLPESDLQALHWLMPLLDLSPNEIRKISNDEFKKAWFSIAFLFMGLHPDGALDHGTKTASDAETSVVVATIEPRLLNPYYERSGWPVALAPIAREAWRRFQAKLLKDDEFYCSEAQLAGMYHRRPKTHAA